MLIDRIQQVQAGDLLLSDSSIFNSQGMPCSDLPASWDSSGSACSQKDSLPISNMRHLFGITSIAVLAAHQLRWRLELPSLSQSPNASGLGSRPRDDRPFGLPHIT